MDSIPSPQVEKRRKLGGYEFYREVLGSPKYIVAPMVDQSELAYRRLTRRYGAQLVYTPMINAKMFMDAQHKGYRDVNFDIPSGEEGAHASSSTESDRPLVIQFCANSPTHLLAAAKVVEAHCDAIDINLGCPQEIAKRGHYGAFLMDEWELVFEMINTLHKNLSVPVTAKFRVFPSIEKTVEYAQMLERAGAQILTCHGRMKEQRGVNSGLASLAHIRAVKEAVSVPVFANGNVLFAHDVARVLTETGADGVMSAEGILYNPALFRGLASGSGSSSSASEPTSTSTPTPASLTSEENPTHDGYQNLMHTNPSHADLALEYLEIVRSLKTRTNVGAVKGHLFKLMRPALGKEPQWDLRERLGRIRVNPKKMDEGLDEYVKICEEMKIRMEVSRRPNAHRFRSHTTARPRHKRSSDRPRRAPALASTTILQTVAATWGRWKEGEEEKGGVVEVGDVEAVTPEKRPIESDVGDSEVMKKARIEVDSVPASVAVAA
ncbi:tRNA-dihydrouridine(16/17) synthase [NAD(P)(+)]-like [Hypsizygus marmoreus]|uniref:tRNA-dihydrouridine(16/17) synthase [NAD(P)(+)] n=1 Tax=Hypsizygus marmoreus TaxID=39966 RepID=A0A369JEN9_HYPMA|nr:tRNA-dihydrouridine(16/17) synthase [NAD(P)(+)]-like [Hypsizygus marmoreus]